MTPGARQQAVLDIIERLFDAGADGRPAADRAVAEYFRRRRYAGSKDRAAIGDEVFGILRRRGLLLWRLRHAGQSNPAARALVLAHLAVPEVGEVALTQDQVAALFSGVRYAPAPLTADEGRLLDRLTTLPATQPPDWARLNYRQDLDTLLKRRFGEAFETEMEALAARAPLDLRVNGLKTTPEAVNACLREEGVAARPAPFAPSALRLPAGTAVRTGPAWRRGLIEVQDAGAQVAARLVDAQPGQQVVDMGAGAGGKTLALAGDMNNKGQIYALDRSRARLAPVRARLERAGVRNCQVRVVGAGSISDLEGHMDRVLVDAPCSGSGTWRRNPDLRWRYGADDIVGLAARQSTLLDKAARLVAAGGRLIYVTCSLFRQENEDVIRAFLDRQPDFTPLPFSQAWSDTLFGNPPVSAASDPDFLQLTPARHGCDGFFIAILSHHAAVLDSREGDG